MSELVGSGGSPVGTVDGDQGVRWKSHQNPQHTARQMVHSSVVEVVVVAVRGEQVSAAATGLAATEGVGGHLAGQHAMDQGIWNGGEETHLYKTLQYK